MSLSKFSRRIISRVIRGYLLSNNEISNEHEPKIVYHVGSFTEDIIFHPYLYCTSCEETPTFWRFEQKYERQSANSNCYVYQLKLRRMDAYRRPVNVTVLVSFDNAVEEPVFQSNVVTEDGVVSGQELYLEMMDMHRNNTRNMVAIRIYVTIENCH